MEKKEARAEKEEAEKYQKLQDDHVSLSVAVLYRIVGNFRGVLIFVIFVTDLAVTNLRQWIKVAGHLSC